MALDRQLVKTWRALLPSDDMEKLALKLWPGHASNIEPITTFMVPCEHANKNISLDCCLEIQCPFVGKRRSGILRKEKEWEIRNHAAKQISFDDCCRQLPVFL